MYSVFVFNVHNPKGGAFDHRASAEVLTKELILRAIHHYWNDTSGVVRSGFVQVLNHQTDERFGIFFTFKEDYVRKERNQPGYTVSFDGAIDQPSEKFLKSL